jgi:hypothetical protein
VDPVDPGGEPVAGDGCQACPLCAALTALRQARPEAVDHLLRAGAELLLAVRALLEPGQARPDQAAAADSRPGGMQRIDIG